MLNAHRHVNAPPCSRRRRLPQRFWVARAGVAATEFALLFPFMLLLLLGGFELSRAVAMMTRTTYMANGLAELVSQSTVVLRRRDLNRILETAPLMNPDIVDFARDNGRTDFWRVPQIVVSSVQFKPTTAGCTTNCQYEADRVFSFGKNTRRHRCGPVTIGNGRGEIPARVAGEGSLIVVDVALPYTPRFLQFIAGPFEFRRTVYLRPRYVDRIDYRSNCPGFKVPS